MNALRESKLIENNKDKFQSIFNKVDLYNYNRFHYNNLNESRFNRKFNIKFNLEEQKAVKDFFKIVEYRLTENYTNTLNENELTEKLKIIKAFFDKISVKTITTVKEFVNKIIELLAKIKDTVTEFFEKVFGFDGFEQFNSLKSNSKISSSEDIPSNQLGAFNLVVKYCEENYKNPELKNISEQMQIFSQGQSLNENFGDWIDDKLKNSEFLQKTWVKRLLGDRDKVGGGKISIWKTIGISILGSIVICTLIPLFVKILVGPGFIATVVYISCKCLWVARGVMKVLYHRSKAKTPDEKNFFTFWTVVQLILVIGTPILFSIPAVKSAFNSWLKDAGGWVLDKLGLKEKVRDLMEYLGLGNKTVSHHKWTEIKNPHDAQREIIGTGKSPIVDSNLLDNMHFKKVGPSFRDLYFNHGHNVNMQEYNHNLVSCFDNVSKQGQAGVEKVLNKFNELHIHGGSGDCYKTLDGTVKGCEKIMLYTDKLGNPKHGAEFLNKVLAAAKARGLNLGTGTDNQIKWGNGINQESYGLSGGNRGAVEIMATDIPATKENIDILRQATAEAMKQALPGKGADAGVFGVMNAYPEAVAPEVIQHDDVVTSFIPNLNAELLYMPVYQDEEGAETMPDHTPEPRPAEIPKQIKGLVLHDVETNKDYPIEWILKDVKMTACEDIMPMNDINKMLQMENDSLEKKADSVKMTNESLNRKLKRLNKLEENIKLRDFNWISLNEAEDVEEAYTLRDKHRDDTRDKKRNKQQVQTQVVSQPQQVEEPQPQQVEEPQPQQNVASEEHKNIEQQKTETQNQQEIVQQEEKNIEREKNLISHISKGRFTITAFMCKDLGHTPAIIFCPFYSMVGVNKQIAGDRKNIFPFKGLFKYYNFRCPHEKANEYKQLLSTLFFDSVMKTYEVIKYTADNWNLVQEKNRMLYPTQDSPQGEIKQLGFLTVKEFCAVHNHTIEPFQLYNGHGNVNQNLNMAKNNDAKIIKSHSKQNNDWKHQDGQGRADRDKFNPWENEDDINDVNNTYNSGASHTSVPRNQSYNPNNNNGQPEKRTNIPNQTKTQRDKQSWWSKWWNKFTGGNESYKMKFKDIEDLNESLTYFNFH